jgi:hypothetical protein
MHNKNIVTMDRVEPNISLMGLVPIKHPDWKTWEDGNWSVEYMFSDNFPGESSSLESWQ